MSGLTLDIEGIARLAKDRADSDRAHIRALEMQLAAAKKGEADALAVLSDLLEERGQGWVMEVIKEREDLMEVMRLTHSMGQRSDGQDSTCVNGGRNGHTPKCRTGHWLRILGGPEETQRQVEAAWEEADLQDTDVTARRQMGETRARRRSEIHSEHCWARLAWGDGECECGQRGA